MLQEDDHAAIQAAIDEGTRDGKAVFFPAGEYRISDTLFGKMPVVEDARGIRSQVYRGIDLDLNRKTRAAGIRHACSQGCEYSDSTITATGSYAGIYNPAGQGGGVCNIKIVGGRYGIVAAVNGDYSRASTRYPIIYRFWRRSLVRGCGRMGGALQKSTTNADYRGLLVDGTSQPLSIYGLNVERVQSDVQVEVRNNARNVSIYYLKSESFVFDTNINRFVKGPGPDCLHVQNSRVSLYSFSGNAQPAENRILVTASPNYLLANIGSVSKSSSYNALREILGSEDNEITGNFSVSIAKRGSP